MDKIALKGGLSLSTDEMRSLVMLVFINISVECLRWDESTQRSLHQACVLQSVFPQQAFMVGLDHPASARLTLPTAIPSSQHVPGPAALALAAVQGACPPACTSPSWAPYQHSW